MAHVFISHVPEDAAAAEELAAALVAAGFSTWPETERSAAALEQSTVVVVLASPDALGSRRVTDEVVHAYEVGRPCVPVLIGLSHVEMAERQPEWRVALGAATSIEVPAEGVAAIAPRVVAGVAALAAPAPRTPLAPGRAGARRRLVVAGAGVVGVLGVVVAVVVLGSGGGGGGATPGSSTRRTEHVIPRSTASFSPGPLADSATTPVRTVGGDLRITRARLQSQVCSTVDGTCRTAPGGDRFVVLTVTEWEGRDIAVTDAFSIDMDRSYVVDGDRWATFVLETQDSSVSGSLRIVYETLPASAVQDDVRLAWPGSPTLTLHLEQG